MLVYEQSLYVLEGVPDEPVGLTAALLFLFRGVLGRLLLVSLSCPSPPLTQEPDDTRSKVLKRWSAHYGFARIEVLYRVTDDALEVVVGCGRRFPDWNKKA